MTQNNGYTIATTSPNPVIIAQVSHTTLEHSDAPVQPPTGWTENALQYGGLQVQDTLQPEVPAAPNEDPDLPTLYASDGCPGCDLTAQAFDRKGTQYNLVELAKHPELIETFKAQGLSSAPILKDTDGNLSAGFRPDRIQAIINAAHAGKTVKPGNTANTSNTVNAGVPAKTVNAVKAGVIDQSPRLSR